MPDTDPALAAAADGLFVVETWDGDAFLGEIAFETGYVVVHSGFRGRPPVLPRNEVATVTPAAEHPDVYIHIPEQRGPFSRKQPQ